MSETQVATYWQWKSFCSSAGFLHVWEGILYRRGWPHGNRAAYIWSNMYSTESPSLMENLAWCYTAQHRTQERVQKGRCQDFLSAVLITHACPHVMNGFRLVSILPRGGNRWWVVTLRAGEHIPPMLTPLDAANMHVTWHQMLLCTLTLVASFLKCLEDGVWAGARVNQPQGHNAAYLSLMPPGQRRAQGKGWHRTRCSDCV